MTYDRSAAEKLFTDKGRIFTGTRARVYECLGMAASPVSTKTVWESLGEGRPDLATVYRSLTAMVELGVVRKIAHGRNIFLYELSGETGHNHRVVCQSCGKSEKLPCEVLANLATGVESTVGFKVDHQSMEISGKCPDCVSNRPK